MTGTKERKKKEAKADGLKFEPDLKDWNKTGSKSIIDMDSKEAQIIADVVYSGMITLTAWSLVNDHMEIKELPLFCISAVGTCTSKLKHLVENVKNKKREVHT